jgi:hypothetical protein
MSVVSALPTVVTPVSIEVFSSFSTNIKKEEQFFANLSGAGAGNELVGE